MKIEDKIAQNNSFLCKNTWNTKAREYIDYIRRNGIDNIGCYDYPAIEVTGIRNLIDDVVNSLSLYIWRGGEKMFEIVKSDDSTIVLSDIASQIQNRINDHRANFVSELQKVIRDWLELGMGAMLMHVEDKQLFFKALNPVNVTFKDDEYGKLQEVFYEFDNFLDDNDKEIDKLIGWIKEKNAWKHYDYERYSLSQKYIEKSVKKQDSQRIFIVRANSTSDTPLARGKGLLMLDTLKLINNIYESLCDVASQKVNKALLIDEKTAMSIKALGQTYNNMHHKIQMPIFTVDSPSGSLLTVLDNTTAPQLAQWLYTITSSTVQQTFSINRLLSVQTKEMTATEVNYRASLDQKYIDFATQTFKNDFLDILIRNMMSEYKYDGQANDYRIVWQDQENKIALNERLQEINATVDLLAKLIQFGQQARMNVQPLVDEITAKTNFTSLSQATDESVTNELLQGFQQALAQRQTPDEAM